MGTGSIFLRFLKIRGQLIMAGRPSAGLRRCITAQRFLGPGAPGAKAAAGGEKS